MALLKEKCLVEYPIPYKFSIWGGNGSDVQPIEDLDVLIETCVSEVSSDILITAYLHASGIVTQMPQTTISCKYAKLDGMAFPFQGNRLVKVSYDQSTKKAYLRYYPAIICYQRRLTTEDADNLTGDRLIYLKSYILWKMAAKELNILKSANFLVDNGQIDLSVLEKFAEKMEERYNTMKPEILLYNTIN